MSCATLISRFFSTNAGAVAFTHSSYSNAYRFSSKAEREELLRDPVDSLADDYVKQHSLRNDALEVYGYFERMHNVKKSGIGLELYLFSLKYFGVAFFLCTLVSIGSLFLNYEGQFFKSDDMDWSVVFGMLGNVLGFSNMKSQDISEADKVFRQLQQIQKYQVIFDATYTLLFLLAIVLYAVWTRQMIEKHRNTHPTLADFALKLTHLPENKVMTIAELLERQGYTIVEIVPIRHLKRLMHHLKCIKHQEKIDFIQSLKAKKKRYTLSQLQSSEAKLNKHNSKCRMSNKVIKSGHSAIFVFNSRADKLTVQKLFHQNWVMNALTKLKVAFTFSGDKHRNWLREVNTKLVPTPYDIYWENVRKRRYLRRYGYYGLAILLILASCTIVFSLKYEQNDLNDSDVDNCLQKHTSNYCECLMGTSSSTDCVNDKVKNGFVKFVISFVIIVVNSYLPWLLMMISTQEKQSSMPRRKLSTMIKCFFGLLINTSFVVLVVSANFQDFEVSKVLRMIDSRFKDLSRYWYPEVGFSILMSMFMGIFSPHFIMSLYYSFKKHCLSCVKNLYDTQITYNYWRMGADIDLPLKTAYQLVIIFGCFMYAGGMPLMLPICALTMFSMYLCERFLLRHYEKPNEHSTILHTWFIKMLPLSVVVHCLFSLYAYGAESIFPHLSPNDWYNGLKFEGCKVHNGTIVNVDTTFCKNLSYPTLIVSALYNASLDCNPFTGSFSNVNLINVTAKASPFNTSYCNLNVTQAVLQSATLVFTPTQYLVSVENDYKQRVESYPGMVFLLIAALALLFGLIIPLLEDWVIRNKSHSFRIVRDEMKMRDFAGGNSYQMSANINYKEAIYRMLLLNPREVDEEEEPEQLPEDDSPLQFLNGERDVAPTNMRMIGASEE